MRIQKTNERWFDVPNDPDKARLKIKHLSPGETQDIFDKVFVQDIKYKKVKKGKDQVFEPEFSQKTDKKLDREMTLKMTVVDWQNFFDQDGKDLKFSAENVVRASREIEGFNLLVTELREQLAKDIAEEKEQQLKNSKGSVSEQVK